TVVSLLFASDKTYLINFSGDKAAWPIYMSISNIRKDIQQQSSEHARILVAFLLNPLMNPKSSEIHRSWRRAIEYILKPIADLDIAGAGYEWDCTNGQVRHCYLVLAAWITDYPEHGILARIINSLCPIC
ncbi:hypothetical protein HOY80DRAFT_868869, partial [Tuber brumale]